MSSSPVAQAPPQQPLLERRGIRKAFAGVEVLKGVDFTVESGRVHALVGENGAGKTTLIKILAGAHRDFRGEIRFGGQTVRLEGPRDAERHGVAVIHQELSLIPHMSIADNLFLGRERVNRIGWLRRAQMRRAASRILSQRLGVELDVTRQIGDVPISVQQKVEIAKALGRGARSVVRDEPTSALSDAESARLCPSSRPLRDAGVGVVYVSHKLDEIYALADRITILRDGVCVGSGTPAEMPRDELVRRMVGRRIAEFIPKHPAAPGRVVLRVEALSLRDRGGRAWLVREASLRLRAGEIVGLAGLLGSGNSELLGAIFGRYGRPDAGTIHVADRRLEPPTPREALRRGVALLTNDRKTSGLVLPMSVLHNLSLAALARCQRFGLLHGSSEWRLCEPLVRRLNIGAPAWHGAVSTLSGGNQQKVVLARWLLTEPRVLLLDEPTRGIDVAAKADIYASLNELTASGLGVLLISSELSELLALSDRVLVMHRRRIVAEFPREGATQENVMRAAMGG